MTKEETLQLKGIAILMMLFLHLFNTTANVEQCHTFINFWNGKPLVLALSRVAAFCVPIYIFLSGYGLAITYKKNRGIMHSWNRIFNLYVNYWIVFLLFIPLACLIKPKNYPGSLMEFIGNFVALDCSYNREWWFFLPYVLLVISSKYIFRLLHKLDVKATIITITIVCILYFTANTAGKQFRPYILQYQPLQIILWYITLSFTFICGALFARYNIFEYYRSYFSRYYPLKRNLLLTGSLLTLCILRMMLGPSILNPLFVIPFLICYICMKRSRRICGILEFWGSHSTNLWLIHTFFAYYLFHDFIYGFRYPILIYPVLLIVSLGSSYIVRFIHNPIKSIIKSKQPELTRTRN